MGKVIDLDREEGARILEKELYLHQLVENIKKELKETLKRRKEGVEEFYNSNFFISGKRGTGKTSVLITLKKEIQEDEELKDKVEILETINLSVNQNSLLSYLLSYVKSKLEGCSSEKSFLYKDVFPAFSNVMAGYPHFLKCSLEESLKRNCNMEVEEFLDNLEGEFLKNLRILIKNFFKDKNLVILLDDFDLVQSKELLYRTFIEIAAFFSMENVHIIAAGDLDNTYKILESFIKDSKHISSDEETAKSIAQSFIDKVFPIYNRFELTTLSILEIRELYVKHNNSKEKLIDFLQKHPTFKILKNDNEDLIYYLFENLTMRELVQVLKSINEKIEKFKSLDGQEITISDLQVSNILARFRIEGYFRILKMPSSEKIKIKVKKGEDLELTFSIKEENIDNLIRTLALYNQELGKRFFKSIYLFSRKNEKLINAFKVENAKDIERKLKLPVLSMISVIDKNFFAFLVVWLTEVLNYMGGTIFFAPYLLLTLATFYNLPNILMKIESKSNETGKKEVLYRDLLNELEYIKDFNDIYELLYILKSLDSITIRKSYQALKDHIAKMIFYFDVIKKGSYYGLVPYYFKLWFIPTLAAISLEENKLKDLIYDRFMHDLEEGESNTPAEKGNFFDKLRNKFKRDLKGVKEEEKKLIRSLSLTRNIPNPVEIDRNIHSITRYLINKFLKEKEKKVPDLSNIRFAFYTFLSFSFFVSIYRPQFYWEIMEVYKEIFELARDLGGKNGKSRGNDGNEKENKAPNINYVEDKENLFILVSRYLYYNSLLANRKLSDKEGEILKQKKKIYKLISEKKEEIFSHFLNISIFPFLEEEESQGNANSQSNKKGQGDKNS